MSDFGFLKRSYYDAQAPASFDTFDKAIRYFDRPRFEPLPLLPEAVDTYTDAVGMESGDSPRSTVIEIDLIGKHQTANLKRLQEELSPVVLKELRQMSSIVHPSGPTTDDASSMTPNKQDMERIAALFCVERKSDDASDEEQQNKVNEVCRDNASERSVSNARKLSWTQKARRMTAKVHPAAATDKPLSSSRKHDSVKMAAMFCVERPQDAAVRRSQRDENKRLDDTAHNGSREEGRERKSDIKNTIVGVWRAFKNAILDRRQTRVDHITIV